MLAPWPAPWDDTAMRAEQIHVVLDSDIGLRDEASDPPMHRANEAGECAGPLRLNILPATPRTPLDRRGAGRGDQVRPVAFAAGEAPDRMGRDADRRRLREVVRL